MSEPIRSVQNSVFKAFNDAPIVYINGPRQAGKSTLAKHVAKVRNIEYATFDDISLLEAANNNPKAFVENLSRPIALDEVQMAGKIFLPLKKQIDDLRHQKAKKINGSFLFTGSANVMALPELADAFVGRMRLITLYPFSTREVYKKSGNFVEILFKKKFSLTTKISTKISPIEAMKKATFPEISLNKKIDSARWFNDYITNLMQRDIKHLSMIDKLTILPQMLKIIASRTANLLNNSDLARSCNMNQMSFLRYRALLEAVFLIFPSVPWFRNIGKRFVKTPKIFFTDTRLLAYFLGVELDDLDKKNPTLFGQVLENFVTTELQKQLSLLEGYSLFHYRTHDGKEIDSIIERKDGKLVAIEVKSSASVAASDFRAIEDLEKSLKKDFICGVVLYRGDKIIPFGKNLFALPIQCLWELI